MNLIFHPTEEKGKRESDFDAALRAIREDAGFKASDLMYYKKRDKYLKYKLEVGGKIIYCYLVKLKDYNKKPKLSSRFVDGRFIFKNPAIALYKDHAAMRDMIKYFESDLPNYTPHWSIVYYEWKQFGSWLSFLRTPIYCHLCGMWNVRNGPILLGMQNHYFLFVLVFFGTHNVYTLLYRSLFGFIYCYYWWTLLTPWECFWCAFFSTRIHFNLFIRNVSRFCQLTVQGFWVLVRTWELQIIFSNLFIG